MKRDCRDTLILAFEKVLATPPGSGEIWAVFNGRQLPLNPFGDARAVFEQGFRPEHLALEVGGHDVVPQFENALRADHAIVFAGRVRAVNEANIIRAFDCVGEGGQVVVAGDKTSGIGSLRKWVAGQQPVSGSFAKYHALAFWCVRGREMPELTSRHTHGEAASPNSDLEASPAGPAFSADEPDKGSELLARFFDERIRGKVADFGAGTGYLTRQLLEKCPSVASVDLLEAEWTALEQAKIKLAKSQTLLEFHWIDVTTELKKKPYDWVIMNPPFHHGLHGGRQADPDLGRRFIQCAASTLVQGGKLLMVANRNLPYEETLNAVFRRVEKIADEAGYKVFEATR